MAQGGTWLPWVPIPVPPCPLDEKPGSGPREFARFPVTDLRVEAGDVIRGASSVLPPNQGSFLAALGLNFLTSKGWTLMLPTSQVHFEGQV